jgi:hypothetical protein
MLRSAFFVILSLLATSNLVFAQTPPNESPPSPPSAAESPNDVEAMEEPEVGDHWTYELRDEITGDIKSTLTNTVTDASANEISVKVAKLGNSNSGYLTFDRSWNIKSNGVWQYMPNDGTGIRAPLAVGKTWQIKTSDHNSTAGVTIKRTGTAKVTAKESVTTRAGTFDTFKIEVSFAGSATNDPTKKWLTEQQTWYAPAIDHWVKRSYVSRSEGRVRERTMVELVEYGRR